MKFLSSMRGIPRRYCTAQIRRREANPIVNSVPKALFSSKGDSSLVDSSKNTISLAAVQNPWVEQKDPNGSALTYFWNPETNETTPLGSAKPRHWIEVKDPNGSGLTYWWDRETKVTTALGAPKPHFLAEHSPTPVVTPFDINQPPQTLGSAMKSSFMWGAGISLAFAAIGALFR